MASSSVVLCVSSLHAWAPLNFYSDSVTMKRFWKVDRTINCNITDGLDTKVILNEIIPMCFQIVCQACSSNKYGLDYLKNQPARVCEHCFQELQKLGNI